MNEFICDTAVMVDMLQKLNEATKGGKLYWYVDCCGRYYVKSRGKKVMERFSVLFSFEGETDAIRIFVDNLHKTYTPADIEVWPPLKALEWTVQENIRSIESALYSMMKELEMLFP